MEKIVCFECGSDEKIHNHHVVPRVKGGTKTIPLCELCHSKVHGDHMLKIQKLASIGRKKRKEEKIAMGLPLSYIEGRPKGTLEDETTFLNKPKNREIGEYLKQGLTIKRIIELTGASNKTIIKVRKLIPPHLRIKKKKTRQINSRNNS